LTPADKEKLDMQARAQQMKINTRLTALQSALAIMQLPNYTIVNYNSDTQKSERVGGDMSHHALLAMATDIEKYILGEIEKETQDALKAMNKPKPTIVPAKEMPASNLRS
jgi:hypothetical protein